MVLFVLDASALSQQQRIDYIAQLNDSLGIAETCKDDPLHISLYTDYPEDLILPSGVSVLLRHG